MLLLGLSDISNNGVLPSVTTPILAVEENSKLFHLVSTSCFLFHLHDALQLGSAAVVLFK